MNKIYKKLVLWFMRTGFYATIVMKVIPYVRFSVYYTSFRGWKYHRGYALLQPGDIVLAVDTKKGTAAIISTATAKEAGHDPKRSFCHAGQCISKDGIFEIAEMTHHDYTRSCFYDFCKEAERVAIVRCADYDNEYIRGVIIPTTTSAGFEIAKYNTAFDWNDPINMYCSLLCYRADKERRMQLDLGDLIGLGVPYVSPEGLHQMKNGKLIWDSDKETPPLGFF